MAFRKYAAALFMACLLAGCATAPAATDPIPGCAKIDDMLKALMKDARYAYTAQSIDSHENVHMYYINPKTRKWVQIRVYDNMKACVEAKGTDWQWALDPNPPPAED